MTVQFVPPVCCHLLSQRDRVRLEAARALGAYSIAKLSCTAANDDYWKAAADDARKFISAHASSHRQGGAPDRRLYDIASDILSQDEATEMLWLISTLGSLMIVSQGSMIYSQSFLRLAVKVAAAAASSSRHLVRTMHLAFWRCFVWSLVLFRRSAEESQGDQNGPVKDWKATWFKGVGFVKQEVRGGNGAALVYSILAVPSVQLDSSESSTGIDDELRVDPWMAVIKDMVHSRYLETHLEGINLISRLLSCIGSSTHASTTEPELDPWKVLPKSFFNGTILDEQSPPFSLPAFDISSVRRLTEKEIEGQWGNLMTLWEIGLEKALGTGRELSLSVSTLSYSRRTVSFTNLCRMISCPFGTRYFWQILN